MNHVPDDLLVTDKNRFAPKAPGRILDQGERLGQNRVQTASQFVRIVDIRKILFPLSRLFAKLIFRERLELLLEAIDPIDERANSFDLPLVL
jgi:hypothetical protein